MSGHGAVRPNASFTWTCGCSKRTGFSQGCPSGTTPYCSASSRSKACTAGHSAASDGQRPATSVERIPTRLSRSSARRAVTSNRPPSPGRPKSDTTRPPTLRTSPRICWKLWTGSTGTSRTATASPFQLSWMSAMSLAPHHRRGGVEEDLELARQEEPQREHERHEHERRRRREPRVTLPLDLGRAARIALHHLEDGGAHPDEDHRQEEQEEPAHDEAAAAERAVQDRELAEEGAEGRRAGDGEEAGQEERPGHGQPPRRPAHLVHELRAVGAVDVAGREEEDALREPVAHGVEHGARGGRAAEPEPQGEDAHVLDRRVRQHPLEVALPDHEDGGERHGEEPHPDERVAREGRLAGGAAHVHHAGERDEAEARDAGREERAEDARRLAVRVRLPRV